MCGNRGEAASGKLTSGGAEVAWKVLVFNRMYLHINAFNSACKPYRGYSYLLVRTLLYADPLLSALVRNPAAAIDHHLETETPDP